MIENKKINSDDSIRLLMHMDGKSSTNFSNFRTGEWIHYSHSFDGHVNKIFIDGKLFKELSKEFTIEFWIPPFPNKTED